MNFTIPAPLGPWGQGKNYSNLTNFQKSSSLQPYMWRKNWMHGDVEQDGLYQNCVFHFTWGRGFAPRAGQNIWTFLISFQLLLWNRCTNLNQFWHKASMAVGEQKLWILWCLLPQGLRGGAKTTKINAIFQNLLYSWTQSSQSVDKTVFSIKPSTKFVKFMTLGLRVQALGLGQSWLFECSKCLRSSFTSFSNSKEVECFMILLSNEFLTKIDKSMDYS